MQNLSMFHATQSIKTMAETHQLLHKSITDLASYCLASHLLQIWSFYQLHSYLFRELSNSNKIRFSQSTPKVTTLF